MLVSAYALGVMRGARFMTLLFTLGNLSAVCLRRPGSASRWTGI